MGNAAEFALEIDRELDLSLDQWRVVIRKLALEALERVVNKTPVGNPDFWKNPPPEGYVGGRARGNWFVSIGEAGTEVTTEVDANGDVTVARGGAVIGTYKNVKGFPQIVIYNNVPYINRLENGYSERQAPAGMVAITVAELAVKNEL